MDKNMSAAITGVIGLLSIAVGFFILLSPADDNPKSKKNESFVDVTNGIVDSMMESGRESSRTSEKQVTVPSNVIWYDTRIDVPAGTHYYIRSGGGVWAERPGAARTQALGKTGGNRSVLLVPGAYYCQLVGKVGDDIVVPGEKFMGTSKSGGRLYLSMNDDVNGYEDNEGDLKVLVRVE